MTRELDEDERAVKERTDEITAALAGVDCEVYYEEDGEEGYHLTIQAGEERYLNEGGADREYDLTYWTRDDTWYWQTVDTAGRRSGPWPCRDLDGNASVAEVAEHVWAAVTDAPVFTKVSSPYDKWLLRGPAGAITFALGGIETHSPKPLHNETTPDHEHCDDLGGPCWSDGSSLHGRKVEQAWEAAGREDAVIEAAMRERYDREFAAVTSDAH